MPFVAHRVFGWEPVTITPEWGLKTIPTGQAYALCGSLQCLDCRLLFLDIRFSDAEMAALYGGYRDAIYTALRERYEPGYQSRNEALTAGASYIGKIEAFLQPYIQLPVAILDWGGDTGQNTPWRTRSSRLDIYDISQQPVIDGVRRVNKSVAQATAYDLVVCSNVLEHVPYPADVLGDIAVAMHRDTILCIEVPHEALMRHGGDAPALYQQKKHWHEHINFFSAKSLRQLLAASGLDILAIASVKADESKDSGYFYLIAAQLQR